MKYIAGINVKKSWIIAVVLVLGFVLRFYRLDEYPALNADEAALGYNAYSLLETGKDEHGNSWPIHFQSFNDWKPGLAVYLIMPMVKLFGLNVMSVRLIPALLGVVTIYMVYLLCQAIIQKSTSKGLAWFPVLAALLLAISPWHIHFSRGAWEVNIATFMMVTGLYFLIRSLEKPMYILVSALFFVLSLYTYHSTRLVSPLLVIGFLLLHGKYFLKNWRYPLIALFFSFIIVIPLGLDLLKPGALSRAAGVGLFADPGPLSRVEEQRGQHYNYNSLLPRILHNKPINFGLAFLDNWSSHYNGEFLFLSGDEIQRNKVPEMGLLYTIELLFLGVAGVTLISRKKFGLFTIIFWWLMIAPVASALTFQSPHALRGQNMIIPLTIFSAYGLAVIIQKIQNLSRRCLSLSILTILFLSIFIGVSRYLLMYYSHMSKEYPFSSQYGVRELVDYLQEYNSRNQKVLVTDRYDQPYILFLFYLRYPPSQFQKEVQLTDRDGFGFSTVRKFANFEFRSIKFDEDRPNYINSILVGTDGEIPDEANIIKEIYGTNGYKYFEVVAN